MKKTILSLSATLLVSGCAPFVAPTAPGAFTIGLQQEQKLETDLVTALRNEDKTLLFLSRGVNGNSYGCGDPRNPKLSKALYAKSVSAYIKNENRNISASVNAALKTITSYSSSIDTIKNNLTQATATLKTLQTAVNDAKSIPPFATYSGAVTAGITLAGDAFNGSADAALQQLAINMTEPLQNAVAVLKNNMTQLTGPELTAFQLWDSCARETLAYLRDVPIGLVNGYKPFVAQSSGVELQTAYNAYLTARQSFQSQNQDLNAALQKILDQNKAIAAGTSFDANALIGALNDAYGLGSSINTVVNPTPAKKG